MLFGYRALAVCSGLRECGFLFTFETLCWRIDTYVQEVHIPDSDLQALHHLHSSQLLSRSLLVLREEAHDISAEPCWSLHLSFHSSPIVGCPLGVDSDLYFFQGTPDFSPPISPRSPNMPSQPFPCEPSRYNLESLSPVLRPNVRRRCSRLPRFRRCIMSQVPFKKLYSAFHHV